MTHIPTDVREQLLFAGGRETSEFWQWAHTLTPAVAEDVIKEIIDCYFVNKRTKIQAVKDVQQLWGALKHVGMRFVDGPFSDRFGQNRGAHNFTLYAEYWDFQWDYNSGSPVKTRVNYTNLIIVDGDKGHQLKYDSNGTDEENMIYRALRMACEYLPFGTSRLVDQYA